MNKTMNRVCDSCANWREIDGKFICKLRSYSHNDGYGFYEMSGCLHDPQTLSRFEPANPAEVEKDYKMIVRHNEMVVKEKRELQQEIRHLQESLIILAGSKENE